jgi:hypothetical protein
MWLSKSTPTQYRAPHINPCNPFPQPNPLQKSQLSFSLRNQPANPPLTIKTQRKKSINFPQKNTKKYKIETLRLLGNLEQTKQTI